MSKLVREEEARKDRYDGIISDIEAVLEENYLLLLTIFYYFLVVSRDRLLQLRGCKHHGVYGGGVGGLRAD